MDIYVVSNVWNRERSFVIGAATDRATAEEIATRLHGMPELRGDWSPWSERSDRDEPARVWTRQAMWANRQPHPTMTQEIVCVPLAGYIGDWPNLTPIDETGPALSRGIPALVTRSEIAEIGRQFGAP